MKRAAAALVLVALLGLLGWWLAARRGAEPTNDAPAPAAAQTDPVPAVDELAAAAPRPAGRSRARAGTSAADDATAETSAWPLRVTVRRADGTPAAGAHVALLTAPTRERPLPACGEIANATADAAGEASFATSPDDIAVLAWTGAESGMAVRREGETACVVTLAAARECTVDVVDAEGRAVAGADVFWLVESFAHHGGYARTRAGAPLWSTPLAVRRTRTDAAGRVRAPMLPEGAVDARRIQFEAAHLQATVLVEAPGFLSERVVLEGDAVRVTLGRAIECRAAVVDRDGRPIPEPVWRVTREHRGEGDQEGRVVALVPRGASPVLLDAGGFAGRTFDVPEGAPDVIDLGTVVLERTPMLRGNVRWPDGNAAVGIMVGAVTEGPGGWHAEWITNGDGSFALEPPDQGTYALRAWAEGPVPPGTTRASFFEGSVGGVRPGAETTVALRHVQAVVAEFVGPDPRPPGFSLSNLAAVARSADGRADYDYLYEPNDRRRVVRLYGGGPWTLVVTHAQLETVEIDLGHPSRTEKDPVPTVKVELRPRSE
jgi:hypothetical protein